MPKTDEILISKIKQDDYSGFNLLFSKYYASLCCYITPIVTDPSTAEDIVQDLFIKLWSDRKKIIICKDIKHYLFRAAKNNTMNFLRAEKNRKKAMYNMIPVLFKASYSTMSVPKYQKRETAFYSILLNLKAFRGTI